MKRYWIRRVVMLGGAGLLVLAAMWWKNRTPTPDYFDPSECHRILGQVLEATRAYAKAHANALPPAMPEVEGAERFRWLGATDAGQVVELACEIPGRHPDNLICVLLSSGQVIYRKAAQ